MIERLDDIDGDPVIEPNGDEEDGQHSEDEFHDYGAGGAGCPISDPDFGVDDQGEGEEADVSPPFVLAIEPDPETGHRKCLGRWGIDTMPHFIGKDASA